jgi:hypothetical protein
MSPDLDRQLRGYCQHLDEQQGALSYADILERSGQLVVVPGRTAQQPSPRLTRWVAVVAVTALAVLAVAISIWLLPAVEVNPQPADQPTVAPDIEAMTDLEVIEAGVAAVYAGDADRAVELFELPDRTDDQIRAVAAYEAVIGGRLTMNCTAGATPGVFTCHTPYHNAMTDAINHHDAGDTIRVVVEDGMITEFAFPDHAWMLVEMGTFLAIEGRFDGYAYCGHGPFPESCAAIQIENLDAWVRWRQDPDPAEVVEAALESWYAGDCEAALFMAGPEDFGAFRWVDCSASSTPAQTIEYEDILDAQVSVGECEITAGETSPGPPPPANLSWNLSCTVQYSNAMNNAVGTPPSTTARTFTVDGWVREPGSDQPWYGGVYPEDTELRDSFGLFAASGDLRDEYVSGGCASARTPECANLIVDNLDAWVTWYRTNS